MTIERTPELLNSICAQLAEGKSLRAICKSEGMPSEGTVRAWALDDGDFFTQYARSRDIGMSAMEDELLEIADTPPSRLDGGGTDGGEVADKRLRVDTRKWIMSKIAPKKYGDKQAVELSGPNGEPIKHEHKASAIAELLAKATQRKQQNEIDIEDLA